VAPTSTATATATPKPTIVGLRDIAYPDKQLLADAVRPYAKAMRLDSEKVQVSYKQLKDFQGTPLVVAITEDGTPLLLAHQNEKGEWQWEEVTIRKLADKVDLFVGTMMHPTYSSSVPLQTNQFNVATITWSWRNREPQRGVIVNLKYVNDQISLAQKSKHKMMLLTHLIAQMDDIPTWLQQITSKQELEQLIRTHVRQLISDYYPFVTYFNVVNEPWYAHPFSKVLGRDQYILIAFEEAEKVRTEIQNKAKQEGKPIPEIQLGFSHAENHYAKGAGTQPTKEISTYLAQRGWVDYVHVHFHVKTTKDRPSAEDVYNTLMDYQKIVNQRTGKPLEIVVGELDVNISDIQGTQQQRFAQQAEIYRTYLKAILDAGVKKIFFWGVIDAESWYETGENEGLVQKNADALLFDESNPPQPKPSYFSVLKVLFERLAK
jgi:GH35 family endo-1,4-beta-xylanase